MVAFKFATLLAAATAVAAYPSGLLARDGICGTGTLNCCEDIIDPESSPYFFYTSLLPLSLRSLGGPIGVACKPIFEIGGSSFSDGASLCPVSPVCCAGSYRELGLIPIKLSELGVNCEPIALPL